MPLETATLARLLVDDKRRLRFEIEGGEILALENGDIMYAGNFQDRDTRPFHNGSVVCIIKVQSNAVTLSGIADGVPTAKISLRAN